MPPAWLAVVALLINALLPSTLTGLSAAERPALAAAFCGHVPANPPPGLPLPAPCDHQCPLCCLAPPGCPPPSGVGVAVPGLVGAAALAAAPEGPAPFHFTYGSPQPRGPPATA